MENVSVPMIISACIMLRNAVINDYPFVESILSVLPLVDEMIVSVDKGDDNTLDVITQINDPKIKITIPMGYDQKEWRSGICRRNK
jgi:hypothetical protein